jgi:hypothetical protein
MGHLLTTGKEIYHHHCSGGVPNQCMYVKSEERENKEEKMM